MTLPYVYATIFLCSPLATSGDISWTFPTPGISHRLLDDNANLYIRRVSLDHAGTYSCNATGLGVFSANLTVLGMFLPHTTLYICPLLYIIYKSIWIKKSYKFCKGAQCFLVTTGKNHKFYLVS